MIKRQKTETIVKKYKKMNEEIGLFSEKEEHYESNIKNKPDSNSADDL